MKTKTTNMKADPPVKAKVGLRSGDTTISKKLREKMDGEKIKEGVHGATFVYTTGGLVLLTLRGHFLKYVNSSLLGIQKRSGPGNILNYIYKSTLGQCLHSQMRQVSNKLQYCTDSNR